MWHMQFLAPLQVHWYVHFNFRKLASSLEPYYCQGCLQQHLLFSCILKSDSDIFSLEHASESQASLPSSLNNEAMTENNSNDTISCQYYNSNHFVEFTKQLTTRYLFMVHCNVTNLNKHLCNLQQYLSELYYEPFHCYLRNKNYSTSSHLSDHQMHGYTLFHSDWTTKVELVLILKKQQMLNTFENCRDLLTVVNPFALKLVSTNKISLLVFSIDTSTTTWISSIKQLCKPFTNW